MPLPVNSAESLSVLLNCSAARHSFLGHSVFLGRLPLLCFFPGNSLKFSFSLSLSLCLTLSLSFFSDTPCTIKSDSSSDGVMYGLWQCNVAVHAEEVWRVRQMLSRGTNKTEGGKRKRDVMTTTMTTTTTRRVMLLLAVSFHYLLLRSSKSKETQLGVPSTPRATK